MNDSRAILLLGGVLTLAACSVGPDYQQPAAVQMPEQWSEPVGAALVESSDWWRQFNDPTLLMLLDRLEHQNLDIQLAVSRLAQSRAQLGMVDSARWPNVDAVGGATHQYRSRNAGQVAAGDGPENNLFQAGFDASWELDLFGSVKRQVEAATADYQAAIAGEQQVRVTMAAETARVYFQLRGLQLRLKIARDQLAAQRESVALANARFQAGLTSDLDVAQAESLLASTQAVIPSWQMQIQQTLNALALLLGEPAGHFGRELLEPDEPAMERLGRAWPMPLPLGLPSDLLRRRSDIQQAERQLAAATARSAQATAAFYPRFMLNGTAGLSSLETADFFEGGSRYYSIGPSMRWPILNFGRLDSQLQIQTAIQEQALMTYKKTILQALADVENSLVAYAREQDRLELLKKNELAQQRALTLSEDLYRRGLTPYVNVLDAQRQVFSVQEQLAQSQVAVTQSLVSLIKALGGPPACSDMVQQESAIDQEKKN